MSDQGDVSSLLAKFGSPRGQAMAAAYAIVTVYDGKIDDAELGQFVELAMDESFDLRPKEVASAFEALVTALDADRDKGDPIIFEAIEAIKEDASAVEAVKKASKAAVLADARVDVRERLVLREIAERLGINPLEF